MVSGVLQGCVPARLWVVVDRSIEAIMLLVSQEQGDEAHPTSRNFSHRFSSEWQN
jgi:hypothetical protein